jgi:dienelactone hydrolase
MRRTEIKSGGTIGVVWEPDQAAEHFVVVLGGSGSGILDGMAKRLSEHGVSAFALGYFGAPGLPSALVEIPVESVQRGVEVFREQFADGGTVALIGVSKGAELALVSASHIAGVGPVVAVVPSCVVWYGIDFSDLSAMTRSSWTWHDAPLPFLPLRPGVMPAFTDEGLRTDACYDLSAYATSDVDAARIPIEQAQGPILLLSGDDDHMWPSAPMADDIVQRMRDLGRGEQVTNVVYRGAGHAFLTRDFLQAQSEAMPFDFGGNPQADRAAAHDAWKRTLSFLEDSHSWTPTNTRL